MKKEFYTPPYLELHRFQIERPFCDSTGTDSLDDFSVLGGLTDSDWDEELIF